MIDKDEIFSSTKPGIDTYMKFCDTTHASMASIIFNDVSVKVRCKTYCWREVDRTLEREMINRQFRPNGFSNSFYDVEIRNCVREKVNANAI